MIPLAHRYRSSIALRQKTNAVQSAVVLCRSLQPAATHTVPHCHHSVGRAHAVVSPVSPIDWFRSPFDKFMNRKDYYRHIQTLDDFIFPFIEKTLALPLDEVEKLGRSDHGFTFLHGLASLTRDPKVIRDQLVAVLLAGRDTTAGTLSWAFCEYPYPWRPRAPLSSFHNANVAFAPDELAGYPEKWKRLREEVLSALGHNEPTYEDLKDSKNTYSAFSGTLLCPFRSLWPASRHWSRDARSANPPSNGRFGASLWANPWLHSEIPSLCASGNAATISCRALQRSRRSRGHDDSRWPWQARYRRPQRRPHSL